MVRREDFRGDAVDAGETLRRFLPWEVGVFLLGLDLSILVVLLLLAGDASFRPLALGLGLASTCCFAFAIEGFERF